MFYALKKSKKDCCMKYLIAIFLPFVSFILIKKPISAYLSFILQVAIILSSSLYSNIYFMFFLLFTISIWAFFEILEANIKKYLSKVIKTNQH
jgi:hypothetical protein